VLQRGKQRAQEVCEVKGGNGSHTPCLKGRGPFIVHSGVRLLWFGYFTIKVELHDQWSPKIENVNL
jgi:hypothetical protein